MNSRFFGLMFLSALLCSCAGHSPKTSTATGRDAFAEFFPGKPVDTTGKLALSYELHPTRPDTSIRINDIVYIFQPMSVTRHEGFATDAFKDGSMMPGTHMYRGDLIDTVPHSLK
jgi:hypothetical protein